MLVVRQNALNSRRRHENKGLGHGVIYSLYSHELSCSVRDQTVIFTMAISEGENAHVALLFYGTCAVHMKAAACVPVKVLNAHSRTCALSSNTPTRRLGFEMNQRDGHQL